MRTVGRDHALSVQAIAGTRVVLFGIDYKPPIPADLLGFAITRSVVGAPAKPLPNFLHFAGSADPSTLVNPLQTFLWGDYTAPLGTDLSYPVSAMHGAPGALAAHESVTLALHTEPPDDGHHGVWVNRGVIGSQAYTAQYGTLKHPLKNAGARAWLSRGLFEALENAITAATGAGAGLRCAFYEFANEDVMVALKAALDRGVDLELLVDKHHDSQKIDTHGLRGVTTLREHVGTPHNKFIIRLEGGQPKSVWTGSTNISDSGIYGQANVGHLVHDEQIAADYLAYWTELHTNPTRKLLVAWTSAHNPDLKNDPTPTLGCVFSAQASFDSLDWYAERVKNAASSAFITAPFGLDARFIDALGAPGPAFRYAIVDQRAADVRHSRTSRTPGRRPAPPSTTRSRRFPGSPNPRTRSVAACSSSTPSSC